MVRIVLMTDLTESYGYSVLSGILDYAGKNWLIHKMPPAFKQRYGFNAVLEWAQAWKADAIIGRFDPEDEVGKFIENGILAIAQDYTKRLDCIPNLTGGYIETGEMAADFFLSKKFRYFAFSGHKNVVWSEERRQGYIDKLIASGVPPERLFIFEDETFTDELQMAGELMGAWLESLPKPIAMFCCDDNEASHIVDICNWKHFEIPEDVSILGVDDSDTASKFTNPPLSSISLDVRTAVFEAVKMIEKTLLLHPDKNFNGAWGRRDIPVAPQSVISRASTESYPTSDVVVVQALKFISQNYQYHINVSDVVDEVPVSRRVLESRFKDATGQSILQYINSLRMKNLATLLLQSDDNICNLAATVGLNEPGNIARVFKRIYGVSPAKYRADNKS